MRTILEPYVDQTIGMNYEKPFKVEAVQLIAVQEGFFSVIGSHKGYTRHFPYSAIVQIIENTGGVDVGGLFHHDHFSVIVKVAHVVQYVPG